MKIGSAGINMIKRFEGSKLTTYVCEGGKKTIGYGHTKTAKTGMTITQQQAEDLLISDLKFFEQKVSEMVKTKITQNQFDALVSFCYNVGSGNLQTSTLLRKLNAGDYPGAAEEFPRWNRAGGKVLNGLIKRREAEKELFLK
ncbi:MAG: lysozyme [Fusobacteriaceae bacterium]